jgi:hypothetical protein
MTVADNYGTRYLHISIMLITANDTIVLFINPLVLGPSEFENKIYAKMKTDISMTNRLKSFRHTLLNSAKSSVDLYDFNFGE